MSNIIDLLLFALLETALVALCLKLYYDYRNKWHKKYRSLLKRNQILNTLLPPVKRTFWSFDGSYLTIDRECAHKYGTTRRIPFGSLLKIIHPDDRQPIIQMNDFANQRGSFAIRIRLARNNDTAWSWHEMRYSATDQTATDHILYGSIRDIGTDIDLEQQLSSMHDEVMQKDLKQTFLANIDSDIVHSFDGVREQTALLTDKHNTLTLEQRQECGDKIINTCNNIIERLKLILDKLNDNTATIITLISLPYLLTSCSSTASDQSATALPTWLIVLEIILLCLPAIASIHLKFAISRIKARITELEEDYDLNLKAIHGADGIFTNSTNRLNEILACIHPSQKEIADHIRKLALQDSAMHEENIYAALREDKTRYEWWQIRFIASNTSKQSKKLHVFLFNTQETISKQEKLRRAITRAEEEKRKADFHMAISHEIRTPFNSIMGYTQLLSSMSIEAFNEEELELYSDHIYQECEKEEYMLHNLAQYTRLESGDNDINIEEFDVIPLVEEIAQHWGEHVPQDITFSRHQYYNKVIVRADRQKLKYIINELVSNAFRFTPSGKITIFTALYYKKQKAVINVVDTGIGIAHEEHEHIFDFFTKCDSYTPGLGIGLNLAQRLSHLMNSEIRVDSAPGLGSTFSIHLPAVLSEESNDSQQ